MTRPRSELPQTSSTPDSVDVLLKALGATEPTPDFGHQLLVNLSMQTRASVRGKRFVGHFALSKPFALAAMLLLVAGALTFHSFSTQHSNSLPGLTQPANPVSPLADSDLTPSQRTDAANAHSPLHNSSLHNSPLAAQRDLSPSGAATLPFRLHLTTANAASSQSTIPTQAALDAQALDDLHAPAQPSPQQADTGQEQLVRLMLRQGEKHDLAQLDPAERIAFAQQESREFNAFFNPPAPRLEISLANRVYAPHAVTLDDVRAIDAALQRTSTPTPSQPTPAGDLK